MPVLTREMRKRQEMALIAAQAPAPSTPFLSSPPTSLANSPASTSGYLGGSSAASTPDSRDYSMRGKRQIAPLDKATRADLAERARLFRLQQLARDAEIVARFGSARTPDRKGKGHSSVVIGATTFQLIRPSKEYPFEDPAMSASEWSSLDDSVRVEVDDQEVFSEYVATEDVPDSPVTSSFIISRSTVSDDAIDSWAREDQETEKIEWEVENSKLRQLGYSI